MAPNGLKASVVYQDAPLAHVPNNKIETMHSAFIVPVKGMEA